MHLEYEFCQFLQTLEEIPKKYWEEDFASEKVETLIKVVDFKMVKIHP